MKAPLFIRRVVGHSMEPTLEERQLVVASGWLRPRSDDLVVAEAGGLEVVKRASFTADGAIALTGDKHGSYGVVPPYSIRGRVIGII